MEIMENVLYLDDEIYQWHHANANIWTDESL